MGSFIEDDDGGAVRTAADSEEELQGWREDPTGRHAERYYSRGLPTKLFRDGRHEGYDDVSDLVGVRGSEGSSQPGDSRAATDGLAPPGWYPDSTRAGWYRYWDGTSWTSKSTEMPTVQEPRLQPPAPDAAVSMTMDLSDRRSAASPDSVIAMLAETAGVTAIGAKAGPATIEHLDIVFLAPGQTGSIVATAIPIHIGQGHAIAEVEVKPKDKGDELIAVATITARLLNGSLAEMNS